MKKNFLQLFGILAITASFFTSCSSDNNENDKPSSTFVVDPNNFQGTIADGEVTLDASKTYKLTG